MKKLFYNSIIRNFKKTVNKHIQLFMIKMRIKSIIKLNICHILNIYNIETYLFFFRHCNYILKKHRFILPIPLHN